MQNIKEFFIDLFKIGSIVIGFTLVMMLFGYLMGAEQTQDKTLDYFKNIDYAEQLQIESIK